jgi:negative regulator of sigma E activity
VSEQYRPSLDELADYVEGLLPEAQRHDVERAVAEDASTAALLAELEALPELLARDPIEPMPADVAARIGDALAAEQAGADSSPGSSPLPGAEVRRLPQRPRRWPAQLLAAAAVVGAIALGSQVVDTGEDADSSGAESAGGAADAATAGRASSPRGQEEVNPARAQAVRLTSTTFAQDVAQLGGQNLLRTGIGDSLREAPTGGQARRYSVLADECAVELSAGKVLAVRLDGRPAILVLRRVAGQPRIRQALAYPARCPTPTAQGVPGRLGQPLARTTIKLR